MLESTQVSLESEEKQKNEALKQKKKLEASIATLECDLDQSQRQSSELRGAVKRLHSSVAELEAQAEKDSQKTAELNGEIAAADFRANSVLVELRDTRRMLEAAERAKIATENDLHEASVHINEMTATLSGNFLSLLSLFSSRLSFSKSSKLVC